MRAAALLLVVGAISIGTATAETPKETYEVCLAMSEIKFKDLCQRPDLVVRRIVFECSPELLALERSMPPSEPSDRAELPKQHPIDEADEIIEYVTRYALPCRIN
jgi:hypothetical protein